MDWAQILVIILSIFLAIFLILAMVLTALLIKVTQQIKSITATAERTALKFESAADNAARFTSPIAVGKMIKSFLSKNKE